MIGNKLQNNLLSELLFIFNSKYKPLMDESLMSGQFLNAKVKGSAL